MASSSSFDDSNATPAQAWTVVIIFAVAMVALLLQSWYMALIVSSAWLFVALVTMGLFGGLDWLMPRYTVIVMPVVDVLPIVLPSKRWLLYQDSWTGGPYIRDMWASSFTTYGIYADLGELMIELDRVGIRLVDVNPGVYADIYPHLFPME